ncbi:unnamed protein product [Cyprideis torosa]|uniref:Endophilin-A n=1 Tax=Cyprideis torosa TaxID=163714 RepID=A0A7R8ZV44_9CRUS|nr:unnamed protein product [Cyprideis torosa]CAG0902267.1 unnamed protein product [Cyprideis torosa]
MSGMAFAGLKKQLNKANQYVSEKMGGAEGTKLDENFFEQERKADTMAELVEELQIKTKEYLQPNPAVRAKMAAVKGISKLSGQAKASTYPQPEGLLGDCMSTFGRKLGEDHTFGSSLVDAGEALKQMADVKYSLDDNIKQNFLEPLHHLQTKDIKEVLHHRKKLQGRRLDYDCKKRKQMKGSNVTDDELQLALDKFSESLQLAQVGMHNLLDNDVEQISQLVAFADGLLEYHRQCTDILQGLVEKLSERKEQAMDRPRKDFTPKTVNDFGLSLGEHLDGKQSPPSTLTPQMGSGGISPVFPPPASPSRSLGSGMTPTGPCCKAIYDFDAENPGELGFKEGDTIQLINQIDENWYEGSIHGHKGMFPTTYVEVINPLP